VSKGERTVISKIPRERLVGPRGDVWSDRFDLARSPGTGRVVAAVQVASFVPEAAAF
jgi:hypothetical protein